MVMGDALEATSVWWWVSLEIKQKRSVAMLAQAIPFRIHIAKTLFQFSTSLALAMEFALHEFLFDLLGNARDFPIRVLEGDWASLRADVPDHDCNHWTGVTLSELYNILKTREWRTGRYTIPSASSPRGIYGCTDRPYAWDRANLDRGHSKESGEAPTGWDCPVVLGMHMEDHKLTNHGKFQSGVRARYLRVDHIRDVPFDDLRWRRVDIHMPTYARYNALASVWNRIAAGNLLLCRTRFRQPWDFVKGGHSRPTSCGRTIAQSEARDEGWQRASNSCEWRCADCTMRYNLGMCTTSDPPTALALHVSAAKALFNTLQS
jgi:hypothetical protein